MYFIGIKKTAGILGNGSKGTLMLGKEGKSPWNSLRLIYTSEVSADGDGSVDERCLRSCGNQIKETEAET